MKIRSRPLYAYLFETGVLNGTPEEIDRAKGEYRRLYKRNWKQQKRPRKELRIEVTLKQHKAIKTAALESNLKPTSYARQVLLNATNAGTCTISKDEVLAALQSVSMAYNALQLGLIHAGLSYTSKAEKQLIHLQQKLI
ncbi:MAG: hypothetical protein JWP94_2942 [Mucilaginibacter sp.]|nr:hypothetical protein [Mucilaginibacter sp.]